MNRILFVLHSHICGGAEKHTLTLMQGLKSKGQDVHFCGPQDSWLFEQLIQAGIPCTHVPLHGYFDLFSLFRIVRLILKHPFDLVHGHMTRGALYAGLSARMTGRKSVSTAHLMDSYKRFNQTDRVIAVSSAVKEMLMARGYEESRIEVIQNGIAFPRPEDSQRARVREELGLEPHQTALCMLSFPEVFKGHDLAIEAISRIGDPDLRLIVIGRTEGVEHVKNIKAHAVSLGVEDQVIFLGHRDDVYRLLSGMDVFLMPSRREAFSLAVIEAAASGLPIIASRVGGLPEILEEGRSGLFFENGNALDLTQVLKELLVSPKRMEELGINAKESVTLRLDESVMVSKTMTLYEQLLATP